MEKMTIMKTANDYQWCVIDDCGRLYVAYSETDATYVQHTVGGTIYFDGDKYR
jgi:hypothetical protein